jgi:hypothetical protein
MGAPEGEVDQRAAPRSQPAARGLAGNGGLKRDLVE